MKRLGSTAARLKLKGIDGDLHKQWIMRFNSMINEEPYQGLKPQRRFLEIDSFRKNVGAGDAWPSSVRDLNCSLKWGNERNPHCLLYVSGETAPSRERKVGTTPGQHVPLMSWAAHVVQWSLQRDAKR